MKAYYNEYDHRAAEWLRELIKEGRIANGDVDERSITEVAPNDLKGYGQCHFFAGIGGWSLSLRMAGVPDDWPIWTGSCPCQPFSAAGQGRGTDDERHLWPAFRWLIAQRNPAIVFGEQVASKAGRDWLAGIRFDLEGMGYACGAADLCAAGVNAPHLRQRLFWLAHSNNCGDWSEFNREGGRRKSGGNLAVGKLADQFGDGRRSRRNTNGRHDRAEPDTNGSTVGMADNDCDGCNQGRESIAQEGDDGTVGNCAAGGLGNSYGSGFGEQRGAVSVREKLATTEHGSESDDWNGGSTIWPCRDGKLRRVPTKPALFPLADGIPGRVGILRGSGNAIVPGVAAEFVRASIFNSSNTEASR